MDFDDAAPVEPDPSDEPELVDPWDEEDDESEDEEDDAPPASEAGPDEEPEFEFDAERLSLR